MRKLCAASFLALTLWPVLAHAAANASPTTQQHTSPTWQTLDALSFPADTRAPFRETRSSKLLRKTAEQTGVLWITDGGEFVMQILEPRQEERRLSEERLSLTRMRKDKNGNLQRKQRSITLDRSKGAHQLLLSIVDVLKGNVDRLQQRFDISSITPEPSSTTTPSMMAKSPAITTGIWSIALTPKNSVLRKDMQQLLLRGKGTQLLSLRAARSNSSWQQIDLVTSPDTAPTGD